MHTYAIVNGQTEGKEVTFCCKARYQFVENSSRHQVPLSTRKTCKKYDIWNVPMTCNTHFWKVCSYRLVYSVRYRTV